MSKDKHQQPNVFELQPMAVNDDLSLEDAINNCNAKSNLATSYIHQILQKLADEDKFKFLQHNNFHFLKIIFRQTLDNTSLKILYLLAKEDINTVAAAFVALKDCYYTHFEPKFMTSAVSVRTGFVITAYSPQTSTADAKYLHYLLKCFALLREHSSLKEDFKRQLDTVLLDLLNMYAINIFKAYTTVINKQDYQDYKDLLIHLTAILIRSSFTEAFGGVQLFVKNTKHDRLMKEQFAKYYADFVTVGQEKLVEHVVNNILIKGYVGDGSWLGSVLRVGHTSAKQRLLKNQQQELLNAKDITEVVTQVRKSMSNGGQVLAKETKLASLLDTIDEMARVRTRVESILKPNNPATRSSNRVTNGV